MSTRVSHNASRSLAMLTAWEPVSPTVSMSPGLCAASTEMICWARERRSSASTAATIPAPRRIWRQISSRTMMRSSPSLRRSVAERDHDPRQVIATARGLSPRPSSPDTSRDWIGADQSTSMLVCSSNRPFKGPLTRAPRASVRGRVKSRKCWRPAKRCTCQSSSSGWASARWTSGMVIGRSRVLPSAIPVSRRRTWERTSVSVGFTAWPWESDSAASRCDQRPMRSLSASPASASDSEVQRACSGPRSSGLMRVRRPQPSAIGS